MTPIFSLRSRRARRVLAALAATALLAGCSVLPAPRKDPTRHYVLTGPAPSAVSADAAPGGLKLGLRAVQVAPYLDGKAMIVRVGDNEIDYRDYARWAEPLSVGVRRMLAARLVVSDRVDRVFPQPFPLDVERDVDVAVNVLRCEGRIKADGSPVASFLCVVEITRAHEGAGSGAVVLRRTFEAPETAWRDGDYAGLARGLSDAVAALADDILAALPAK